MHPYLTSQAPWFAFLVHPRDLDDVLLSGPGRFLRHYSEDDQAVREKLRTLGPMVTGEARFGFSPVRGELVGVARLPEDLTGAQGCRAVAEAAALAVARGARVIGLGGLTSPATGGGQLLLGALPPGVTLTNGNAYTAAVIRANVLEAAKHLGRGRRTRVAVVGCTGSVGVPASRLLAREGLALVLVGRSARRAEALLGGAIPQARFAGSLEAVADCDVVVTLTADPAARIPPGLLRPGAAVLDGAQPANIPVEDRPRFRAAGIAVAEAGLVTVPGFTCGQQFRSEGSGTFACLAETYLFAREGLREHSVGRPEVELADKLEGLARRRGILPAPLLLHTDHDHAAVAAAAEEAS